MHLKNLKPSGQKHELILYRRVTAIGKLKPAYTCLLYTSLVALTDAENGVYGLVLSLDKSSHLQDNLNLFCLMFGGNYYDFSLEGTQKAVKFLYDLINTYGVVRCV